MLHFFSSNPRHRYRAFATRCTAYACALMLMVFGAGISPSSALAQFFEDEYSSDVFEDSDLYFETSADDSEDLNVPGKDITEGDRFIEDVPDSLQAEGGVLLSPQDIRLAAERDNFPANIGWGGGLGLLLGSWFAMIRRGDSRSSLRSLGVGTVLGLSLGTLMGLRSLVLPDAPRPSLGHVPRLKLAPHTHSPFQASLYMLPRPLGEKTRFETHLKLQFSF